MTSDFKMTDALAAYSKRRNMSGLSDQLNQHTASVVKDKEKKEQNQASGDTDQGQDEKGLEDMLRTLNKQLKNSDLLQVDHSINTNKKQRGDMSASTEKEVDIPDLLDQLDELADAMTADKDQQGQCQASGDSAEGQGDSLEDMLRTLHKQINTTDWLQENTADKWIAENPQLAKDYMEAMKKS